MKRICLHSHFTPHGQVPSNYLEVNAHDGSTSPLHDAAKRGNMELLRECLLNKMPVNQGDAAGEFEASSELEADEVQKWIKKSG